MNRTRLTVLITVILIGLAGWFVWQRQHGPAGAPARTTDTARQNDTAPAAGFDKQRYSLDDAASPWVIVNKQRPLQPLDYAPALADPAVQLNQAKGSENMRLAAAAVPDLERMFAAAQAAGTPLALASGYRSYTTQVRVYNREVANQGRAGADLVSARPGHSEHQTGLAADVSPAGGGCVIEACFGDTAAGKWVRQNAWQHGFVLRYEQGATATTGYSYEPWHLRWVGKELAAELNRLNSPTLEDFFGLPAAPGY